MKAIVVLFFFTIYPICLLAQIRLGIRDNKFVGVSYAYNKVWSIKLEESIFSEDFKYQYVRGYLNFEHRRENVGIKLSPYYGIQWNGNFQDYGILCNAEYVYSHTFIIHGILNPHKDTSFGYTTCYEIGGILNATSNIGFCLCYRNIPEYRVTSKRIRAGMIFSEGRLMVAPLLSIPTDETIKNTRLLINFEWTFKG